MKVNTIPFDISFARDGLSTRDPLTKKSSSGDALPPTGGADSGHDVKHAPVRPVVNGLGLGLEFSVDKDTGVTIIKVLDVETGKVIRQIPPEEVVAFMRQFEKNGPLLSRWL
jgi:hypothetical protein